MKLKFFLKSSFAGILGTLSLAIFTQVALAENTKISCNKDLLATKISFPTHSYYLRFGKVFPNDLNRAQKLCEDVAQKLQGRFESDRETNVVTGTKNNRVIVCLTSENGCTANSEILFALKRGESKELLDNLLEVELSEKSLDEGHLSTFGSLQTNFWQRTIRRFTP